MDAGGATGDVAVAACPSPRNGGCAASCHSRPRARPGPRRRRRPRAIGVPQPTPEINALGGRGGRHKPAPDACASRTARRCRAPSTGRLQQEAARCSCRVRQNIRRRRSARSCRDLTPWISAYCRSPASTVRPASVTLRSQRAMGEMASALAHELNQPLSAANYIQGSLRLLEKNWSTKPLSPRPDHRRRADVPRRRHRRRFDFVSKGGRTADREPAATGRSRRAGHGRQGPRLRLASISPAISLVMVDEVQIQQVWC